MESEDYLLKIRIQVYSTTKIEKLSKLRKRKAQVNGKFVIEIAAISIARKKIAPPPQKK